MKYTKNVTRLLVTKGDRSMTLNTVYFIRKEHDILVEHVDSVIADFERVGWTVHRYYD